MQGASSHPRRARAGRISLLVMEGPLALQSPFRLRGRYTRLCGSGVGRNTNAARFKPMAIFSLAREVDEARSDEEFQGRTSRRSPPRGVENADPPAARGTAGSLTGESGSPLMLTLPSLRLARRPEDTRRSKTPGEGCLARLPTANQGGRSRLAPRPCLPQRGATGPSEMRDLTPRGRRFSRGRAQLAVALRRGRSGSSGRVPSD